MAQESGIGEILKYALLAAGVYVAYEYFFAAPSVAQPVGATTIPTTAAAVASANPTPVSTPNSVGSDSIQVHIDAPQSGQTLTAPTTFYGWYVDTTDPITAVQVAIDGIPVNNVYIAGSRTDVCLSNNYPTAIGCPNVGWSVTVDPSSLSNGQHTVVVTAFSNSGASASVQQAFNVTNQSQPVTNNPTPSSAVYPGYYVPPDNTTQLNAGLSSLRSLRKKTVKEVMSADLPMVNWVN